jgi:hypothetical protein
MRLTIESTNMITTIDGRPCRIWKGRTESGREVDVFVHRIATADLAAQAELEREMIEMGRPVEVAIAELEADRIRRVISEN